MEIFKLTGMINKVGRIFFVPILVSNLGLDRKSLCMSIALRGRFQKTDGNHFRWIVSCRAHLVLVIRLKFRNLIDYFWLDIYNTLLSMELARCQK